MRSALLDRLTATLTDPTGKQRKLQYDPLGHLLSAFEPDIANGNSLTQQTSYSYNVLDELTQVSQGAQTRAYGYDTLGRLTSATTPEAGQVSFTYDSFDNLLTRTDARSVVTNYTYDALNRPTGLRYTVPQDSGVAPMSNTVCDPTGGTNPTANTCFYYDQGGSAANALDRVTRMVDSSGSETYTYDLKRPLVTTLAKVIGTTTYTLQYSHNDGGEMMSVTYPSGRQVQMAVDAIGRATTLSDTFNSASTTYASGFAYNTAGQVTGFNYGNGVAATFGYSADRLQMTSLKYMKGTATLFSLNYALGAPGNNNGLISGVTDNVDSGRSVAYTYDPLARLSTAVTTGSANYPQWGLSWTYDRYANRTAQTVTAGSGFNSSVTVDAATNRLTGAPYAYDASGNMTNDGNNTLVYDGENRVVSATNASNSGAYTYDGNGLRVKKVSGNTTTVYIFSASKVIAEYQNGVAVGSPTKEYIYTGSQLIATLNGTTATYHHRDHLSVRLTTDSSGNKVGEQAHYPYGEQWYATNTTTKWQFTSYERDAESGNDYAVARHYISRLGRFSSPDPFGGSVANPQSLNRYTYVLNNPVSFIDPAGLFCKWEDHTRDDEPENGGASKAECLEQGGEWVDTSGPGGCDGPCGGGGGSGTGDPCALPGSCGGGG